MQQLTLFIIAITASWGAEIPDLQFGANYNIISSEKPNSDCGGALFNEGVFSTPHYPSTYPNHQVCTWTLTAPEGKVIRLVFTDFSVEYGVQCSYDSVKIYNGPTTVTKTPAKTLCGTKRLIEHVGAKVVTVVFTSNEKTQETGFTASFHSISDPLLPAHHDQGQASCGGDYQGAFGTVASPNYPDLYPNNASCSYTITVANGGVHLEFLHVDIEYHHSCQKDYLEIREENMSGKLLRTVCGSSKSRKISSTARSLHLRFISDQSLQGTGFYAFWKSTDSGEEGTPNSNGHETPKVAEPAPSTVAATAAPTPAPTTTTTPQPPTAAPVTRSPSTGQGTCVHHGNVYGLVAGTSCKSFTQLAHGSHFRHECPDGLAFDLNICVCRFPGDFVCPTGGYNPSLLIDAPKPVEPKTDAPTTKATTVTSPTPAPTRPVPAAPGTCVNFDNVYTIVKGGRCHLFTQRTSDGTERIHACPAGLLFDLDICICRNGWDFTCSDK